MSNLVIFKSISNFINELEGVYGEKQRSLVLYNHLINKTTIVHDKPIQKHISIFKEFCVNNRDAILNKDKSKIADGVIEYSEKVKVDIKSILAEESDAENLNIIWSHLLTLLAMVDPTSNARKILQEAEKSGKGGNEINFLTDIIDKVEKNVDVSDTENPMNAINGIMQSGLFQDLVGDLGKKIDDGSLDVGKLVNSVQDIVSQQPGGNDIISTMMGTLSQSSNSSGDSQPGIDPNMLMSMMSMLQPQQENNKIEEI